MQTSILQRQIFVRATLEYFRWDRRWYERGSWYTAYWTITVTQSFSWLPQSCFPKLLFYSFSAERTSFFIPWPRPRQRFCPHPPVKQERDNNADKRDKRCGPWLYEIRQINALLRLWPAKRKIIHDLTLFRRDRPPYRLVFNLIIYAHYTETVCCCITPHRGQETVQAGRDRGDEEDDVSVSAAVTDEAAVKLKRNIGKIVVSFSMLSDHSVSLVGSGGWSCWCRMARDFAGQKDTALHASCLWAGSA